MKLITTLKRAATFFAIAGVTILGGFGAHTAAHAGPAHYLFTTPDMSADTYAGWLYYDGCGYIAGGHVVIKVASVNLGLPWLPTFNETHDTHANSYGCVSGQEKMSPYWTGPAYVQGYDAITGWSSNQAIFTYSSKY